MITVLVAREIDITQLLDLVLDNYKDELTPEMREDSSLFVKHYLDILANDCFNEMDTIEFDIDFDNTDWYYDQIQKDLQKPETIDYIHSYFQD